jgi:hypothetical protein
MAWSMLLGDELEGDEPALVLGLESPPVGDVAPAHRWGEEEVEQARLAPAEQPGAEPGHLRADAGQALERAKEGIELGRAGHFAACALGRFGHID